MSKARDIADLGAVTSRLDTVGASDGALSNRNILINGAMQVAQRGTSFGPTISSNQYLLDRWFMGGSLSDITITQEAGVNVNGTISNTIKLTGSAATGFDIYQSIEDWRYLSGKTVTMSFWYRTNVDGIVVRQYATATHDTLPNTSGSWQYRSVTFTLGTLQSNPRSANCATFGFWDNVTGNFVSGSYFEATQVQLEVGDTATPFEHRSYGDELARCQRYYQEYGGDYYYPFALAVGISSTLARSIFTFPVPMRTAPTFTSMNATSMNIDGTSTQTVSSLTGDVSTPTSHMMNINTSTGFGADGTACRLYGSNGTYSAIKFDAEL